MSKIEINTREHVFYLDLKNNIDRAAFVTTKSLMPFVEKNFTVIINASTLTPRDADKNVWLKKILKLVFTGNAIRFVQVINESFQIYCGHFNPDTVIAYVNSVEQARELVKSNQKHTGLITRNRLGHFRTIWIQAIKKLRSVHQHIFAS